MVHLLHRLYGVDAPALNICPHSCGFPAVEESARFPPSLSRADLSHTYTHAHKHTHHNTPLTDRVQRIRGDAVLTLLEGKYSLESTDPRESEICAHLRP